MKADFSIPWLFFGHQALSVSSHLASVTMRVSYSLAFSAFTIITTGIIAQEIFEPANFNVTEALIGNGVNVSAIPELSNLVVQSSLKRCSIAVSQVRSIETTVY